MSGTPGKHPWQNAFGQYNPRKIIDLHDLPVGFKLVSMTKRPLGNPAVVDQNIYAPESAFGFFGFRC